MNSNRLFERHGRIAGNSVYDRSTRRRYQEPSRLCLYARTAALCGANCAESVRNAFVRRQDAKLILMIILDPVI